MEKQDKYRIVCKYPSDKWVVHRFYDNSMYFGWITVYDCTAKGKEGYEEAKKWINEQK